MQTPELSSAYPQERQQYILMVQFQLQREKDKNRILEERLKNKQMFISQIKEMHQELQMLSQQCRQELKQEKERREEIQFGVLREYSEKIIELQHQIQILKSRSRNERAPNKKYLSKNQSKTLQMDQCFHSNQLERQKQVYSSPLTNQVLRNNTENDNGLTKFTDYFLEMTKVYIPELASLPVKKQLKTAWKWVKEVVRQRDQLKCRNQMMSQSLKKLNEIVGSSKDNQIQKTLGKITKLLSKTQLVG